MGHLEGLVKVPQSNFLVKVIFNLDHVSISGIFLPFLRTSSLHLVSAAKKVLVGHKRVFFLPFCDQPKNSFLPLTQCEKQNMFISCYISRLRIDRYFFRFIFKTLEFYYKKKTFAWVKETSKGWLQLEILVVFTTKAPPSKALLVQNCRKKITKLLCSLSDSG